MKLFLLFFLLASSAIIATDTDSIKTVNYYYHPNERGLEIRYIEVVDQTQVEITVDGKKYKLFKTRIEAIDYATSMYPKTDYVIVYVMSNVPKTTEVVEIQN